MRVVVNQLSALGRKTGVGHYARQLLLALRAHAGEHEVHSFPRGWVRGACRTLTRARPYLAPANSSRPRADLESDVGIRGLALEYLRRRGRATLGKHFRTVSPANSTTFTTSPTSFLSRAIA